MSCFHPLELHWNMLEKKYKLTYDAKNCDPARRVIVPCGKCPACKGKWRTDLAQRVRHELSEYDYNNVCFLTLTVNNCNIASVFPNGSLNHKPFQDFVKRLRRHLEYRGFTGKIKYLMCGEYGEKNGRAHYHVLLFGWKPNDLKFVGLSAKGQRAFKSETLNRLWARVGATKEQIRAFNKCPKNREIVLRNGKEFDYLPLGFIDVGEVTENTAPYMAKYIAKFGEIKQEDFTINGNKVKKPYLVYPKKRIGIDFFLENFEQILKNGFIYDSRGRKQRIPRSYLDYCERQEEGTLIKALYNNYKLVKEQKLEEYKEYLTSLGYDTPFLQYWYALEQGRIAKENYYSYKNRYLGGKKYV